MTAAQSLKIYEILGKHFNNPEDARIVVTEIELIIEAKIADKKDVLSTKEDIARLETKIADAKVDIIRWVFGFFMAMALMIIALFFRK